MWVGQIYQKCTPYMCREQGVYSLFVDNVLVQMSCRLLVAADWVITIILKLLLRSKLYLKILFQLVQLFLAL